MASASRFECPSSALKLRALLLRARHSLLACLALGLVAHLALTRIAGVRGEQQVAKPLTTQFVKRQPRLTKPLELKKRPQPKRRTVEREMVALKAKARRDELGTRFQAAQAMRGLAKPSADIGRMGTFARVGVEPMALAGIIEGSKDAEDKIDMSLELLDIEALNTGEHHAMVIQDPTDRRNIKGFCRLAVVYSRAIYPNRYPKFEDYVMPAYLNLAEAMNQFTNINTEVMGKVPLSSAELMQTPWGYFMTFYGFILSEIELRSLGEYLLSGGFIFADGHHHISWRSGYESLGQMLLSALGTQGIQAAYEALPNSHPVYHCYFDFEAGPPAASDAADIYSGYAVDLVDHLDGLIVDNRLVAILSRKGYYSPWANWGKTSFGAKSSYVNLDPIRQLQFGVNTIIFALTQEGSITRRLMDSVR